MPPVHYKKDASCPTSCKDPAACKRIQETSALAHTIVEKLGEKRKIFQGMSLTLVGSVKEGTRAFFSDEADLHLSLNKELKEFFTFDIENQKLMVTESVENPNHIEHKEGIAPYIMDDNSFDVKKFFNDFLSDLYGIVSTLELDPEKFKMCPLTVDYIPCLKCMVDDWGEPQARRCRHVPGCQPHAKGEETCGCKEYTSPSFSRTKIGMAFHLCWRYPDGTVFHIDFDFNVQ